MGSAPLRPSTRAAIAKRLLRWYDSHARDLPWRRTREPYRIWVSEIMLQQTRVETVLPYYEKWLRAFPTVSKLAAAAEADVLRVWEGLGYYARARNLRRAARLLVSERSGRLPASVPALRALPGIGRYTAGAIASIAFGVPAAALDGNVKRVLARVCNIDDDIRDRATVERLWELAEALVSAERPGDFNQALMELGARLCTPSRPDCHACPLRGVCRAEKLGLQAERPVAGAQEQRPHFDEAAAVLRNGARALLVQRAPDGLLGGLWRFPGGRPESGESVADCLRRTLAADTGARIIVGRQLTTVQHAYTHFRVTVHVHECTAPKISALPPNYRWANANELTNVAMGKVDRTIAKQFFAIDH